MSRDRAARTSALTLFLAAAHVVAPGIAEAPTGPAADGLTPDQVWDAARADGRARRIVSALTDDQRALVETIVAGMCLESTSTAR